MSKAKAPWFGGLVAAIKDEKNHIISSKLLVVINDKFPKAKHHFLVLPREDIKDVYQLRPEHLPLLEEMRLLAQHAIESKRVNEQDFLIGFHAVPSMERLHLHVISKDFVSDCLKTKKHWNSFTTGFFLPYDDILQQLKENHAISRMNKDVAERYLSTELRCNQCQQAAKNMPQLKKHLLAHWEDETCID